MHGSPPHQTPDRQRAAATATSQCKWRPGNGSAAGASVQQARAVAVPFWSVTEGRVPASGPRAAEHCAQPRCGAPIQSSTRPHAMKASKPRVESGGQITPSPPRLHSIHHRAASRHCSSRLPSTHHLMKASRGTAVPSAPHTPLSHAPCTPSPPPLPLCACYACCACCAAPTPRSRA